MFKPQDIRFPAEGWICVVQGGGDPMKIVARVFLRVFEISIIIETPEQQIITIVCPNIAEFALSTQEKMM